MKWAPLIVGLFVSLVAASASAATIHVDGGARACPGDGSEDAPFCSFSDGLDAATPGDVVALREFDGAYPVTDWPGTAVDGTAEQRIVVEPAPGHAPVIGGRITINNRSYWTIRGLTIDGTENPSGPGIEVRSPSTSSRGVHVIGNRVLGIRGRAIKTGLFTDQDTFDVVIEDNYVNGGVGAGIELTRTFDSTVRNNVVEGVTCTTGQFKLQEGILAIESDRPEIVGNNVSNFAACAEGPEMLRATGIRARKSNNGSIRDNLVSVQAESGFVFAGGISIHEESGGWTVVGNIVRDSVGCGLCDGGDFGFATDNLWAHNTVVSTTTGVRANESTDATFEYNLLVGTDVAASLGSAETGASFRGNVFFTEAGAGVAFDDRGDDFDLAGWAASCGCSEADAFADPQLTVDGMTPGASSPAVDAGQGSSWREDFVGDAADVGALEPPAFVSGTISSDGLEVILEFDNAANPPLQPPDSCSAFEVVTEGNSVGLAACQFDHAGGSTTVRITLSEPLYRDAVAELRTLPTLTDASDIGGAAATVEPIVVSLDTSELPLAPETSGSGSSGSTSVGPTSGESVSGDPSSSTNGGGTTDATSDGVGDQTPPSDHGCGCASTPRGSAIWLLLLIFAGLRRPER